MSDLDTTLLARIVLGVPFVLAGFFHLRGSRAFLLSVLEYRVLPVALARLYARSVSFVGIIAGLLLLLGLVLLPAAVVLLVLLASFAIAVSVNLLRGRRFGCGCFGSLTTEQIGIGTLLRIAILGAVGGLVLWTIPATGRQNTVPWNNEIATVLVAVCLLLIGYLAGNVALFRAVLLGGRRPEPDGPGRARFSLDAGTVPMEGLR